MMWYGFDLQTISYMAERVVGQGSFGIVFQVEILPIICTLGYFLQDIHFMWYVKLILEFYFFCRPSVLKLEKQ